MLRHFFLPALIYYIGAGTKIKSPNMTYVYASFPQNSNLNQIRTKYN